MLASSKLGQYELRAELGRGGSGVVYEAFDTKLKRQVAIKVLYAGDSEARPLREIRAAALLDHPGIAHIFESGEDSGRRFIAMEFVPGESLDQILRKGALPREMAIGYASQIPRALEVAHTAGVVHRDLKPSNLMVTPAGEIRIVDFGLAKVTGALNPAAGTSGVSDPTSSLHWQQLTSEGSLTGTLAYMSPEQAEGKAVDARSDIFSFGAVLYEMLTGSRAFGRESQVATLVAVMSQEPEPIAAIPAPCWSVLKRCLSKDPRERWRTAADLRFALERSFAREVPGVLDKPQGANGIQTRSRRDVLLWTGGIAGAATAAFFAGRRTKVPVVPSFEQLTFVSGQILTARLGPDGSSAYFSYQSPGDHSFRVFETHFGTRTMRALDLPAGHIQSISSQGQLAMILTPGAFEGTLARASRDGGPVKALANGVLFSCWGPNGRDVLGVRISGGTWRLEYPLGTLLAEKDGSSGQPFRYATLSPDGRKIAFFEPDPNSRYEQISILDLDRPRDAVRVISRGWMDTSQLNWLPERDELWFCAGKPGVRPRVFACDPHGSERCVAEVPGELTIQDVRPGDFAALAVSHNTKTSIHLTAIGPDEDTEIGGLNWPMLDGISDDGDTILVTQPVSAQEPSLIVFIYKRANKVPIRIGEGDRSSLSPDGSMVAVSTGINGDNRRQRLLILPVGPGEVRDVSRPGFRCEFVRWFGDGERLLLTGEDGSQLRSTFILSPKDLSFKQVTAPGTWGEMVSRDGRSLLVKDAAGQRMVKDLDSGAMQKIGTIGETAPPIGWHADGKSIFFVDSVYGASTIEIGRLEVASGRVTRVHTLKTDRGWIGRPAITPDGKHCAYIREETNSTLYLARGFA